MDKDLVNAQNMQVCFLTQAMRGAVTPNWRSVAISFQGNSVGLHFILEQESAEDREEIQDVADEFSTYQEDAKPYMLESIEIRVTTEPLAGQDSASARVVYRRKESE